MAQAPKPQHLQIFEEILAAETLTMVSVLAGRLYDVADVYASEIDRLRQVIETVEEEEPEESGHTRSLSATRSVPEPSRSEEPEEAESAGV